MAAPQLVSMNYASLAAARALVDAAWDSLDPPPAAADTQRAVAVRVMVRMYVLCGGINFVRGYVQAFQERMGSAGMPVPTSAILRWYRSRLADDPGEFLTVPGVDAATVEGMMRRYGR